MTNPFLIPLVTLLLTTTGVLIALFSRRAATPGLSEVICLLEQPQGSAD